ncbi:amidase, Asp-tRNAAsn/Glu-tRNAGln amidotransferase A subunit [Schinkia azotoformans MEV2011]|uniref:Amidase, Asp-tRNAAsn/Glu-tRNAGln amidotransferase A subunit n=1 Tax=Schinkia azotoformans MEV2011 TaxID=1348973 RepID=A0A072NNV3_SCHAZ|nr:amidase [Schinkia azotoformans]KEF38947.1 amidase, Asp-tRNAAsn/Glu-tRNAGln amidotransferase A subunit [Schinkia azotoformans MEV2011]MEC1694490.1 amidase [Schinkia azotoformans]MEC1723301.1 amidase [Schinkia azotoformans]MEC1772230.1 amidase [Schinkia azotoformans]MEC1779078.1 amidase [Schinkia azotoformans]
MNELLFETIENVGNAIKNKQISPVELTQMTLNQIREHEPNVNAFITVMEEEALAHAKQLEAELMNNQVRGPLHGLPIAIKDILQTAGVKTTGGSKIFEGWIPDEDAAAVQKLRVAGVIMIGKANLHEFAMGATTENPHYGSTKNPWNVKRIPGGSSGGSAVATATGMAFGAVGTDTAGSIRLPAAMCGTVGFKPTYGVVSRRGCLPFSWSLDHVGPMTRTVRDAAIMLEVMKGYDQKDQASVKRNVPVLYDSLPDLKGIKLGFYEPYMFAGIDAEVRRVIDEAFRQLEVLGAEIVPIDLPGINEALNALKAIAQSEVLSVHEPLLKKFGHLYGDDLKYRFEFGSDMSAIDYIRSQRRRDQFVRETIKQMNGIDALVGPTNVQPPFEIGTMVPEMAISNMFTLGKTPLANILGFPSLSVACGFTLENLPVGLQLIGKPFTDQRVLQIGDCYEKSMPWVKALRKHVEGRTI